MILYILLLLLLFLIIINLYYTTTIREKVIIKSSDIKENLKKFYSKPINTQILISIHNGSKEWIQYDGIVDYITNKKSKLHNPKIYQDYIDTQNRIGIDYFNIYNINKNYIYLNTTKNKYKFTIAKLNFIKWCIQNKVIDKLNNNIKNI